MNDMLTTVLLLLVSLSLLLHLGDRIFHQVRAIRVQRDEDQPVRYWREKQQQ